MQAPRLVMSAVRWAWITCGLLSLLAARFTFQSPELRAKEVLVTRSMCGATLSAGSPVGNWTRVLFPPDTSCLRKFRCKLTFELQESVPAGSSICVDYSRMKILGRKSVLLVEDTSNETSNFKERLTEKRYPMIETYMSNEVCIKAHYKLELTFRADCNQRLDDMFEGWMYVFVQSDDTGRIYFVDGGSKHRFRMSRDQPRVSLRSHVWTDVPSGSPRTSTMRISVAEAFTVNLVCIEWNRFVTPVLPHGVRLRIFKTYYNQDTAVSTYVTLQDGDRVESPTDDHNCHSISNNIHEVVFEVSRVTQVPVESSWKETELLFDLILGVNNYKSLVYGTERDSTTTDTHITPLTDDYDTEDDESSLSFFEKHRVKIGLGAGAVALAIIVRYWCRHIFGKKRKEDADESGIEDTAPNQMEADNADSSGAEPDSLPMVTMVTPSAPPAWSEIDREPVGGASESNAPMTSDPPAYADLFPDKA
ncbi:hypothetical protein ACOMHN_044812 [Nucella lapillus]